MPSASSPFTTYPRASPVSNTWSSGTDAWTSSSVASSESGPLTSLGSVAPPEPDTVLLERSDHEPVGGDPEPGPRPTTRLPIDRPIPASIDTEPDRRDVSRIDA